jgi:chromosome segregation ATPase
MNSRKSELDKIGNLLKGAFDGRYSSKLGEYKPLPEPPVSNRDSILESIKFENIARMPISQTKVGQSEFPNMEKHWGQNTVSFISALVAEREKFKQDNERVLKLLDDKTLNDGGQTQKLATLTEELDKLKGFEKKFVAEQKTVAQQLEKINALTSTNATMNAELAEKLKDFEKYKTDLQKSQNDFEINAQRLNDYKKEMDEIIKMNQTLKTNLDKLKTVESFNALLSKTIKEQSDKIKELEENIKSTEEAVEEMDMEYKINERKIQIVFGAQMELMKKQYSEVKNSSMAELISKMEEAKQKQEEDLDALQKSITECETAKKSFEITIAANNNTIQQNNAKISEITDNIALLNSQNVELTESLTVQTNENEQNGTKMLEMEREMNQLKNENETLKQDNAKMKETMSQSEQLIATKTIDNTILKQTYEEETLKINLLKQQNVDISTIIEQQKEVIENAERKDEEMQAQFIIKDCLIQNSIDSLTWKSWNDAKSYFVDKYGSNSTDPILYQVKQSTNLTEIMSAFGLLKTALTSSSSVEPTCMKNLVDVIIKFLQAEDARDELKKMYDSVPTDENGKKVTQNYLENKKVYLETLVEEHTELSKKCDELQAKMLATEGANNDLHAEKDVLNAEIERLNQRLIEKLDNLDAEAKRQMEDLASANQQSKQTNANLTSDLAQMTAELAQIKKALEESNATVVKHLDTISQINAENEKLQERVARHLADIQLLQDEFNADLTQQVTDALEENRALTSKLQSAIDEDKVIIDGINAQNTKIVEENSKLKQATQDNLETKERELAAIKTELEETNQKIATKEGKLETTEENLAAKEQELVKIKQDLANKERELVANKEILVKTQASLATNKDILAQLENSHTQLRDQLEKLQQINKTQQEEHARQIQEAKEKYDKAIADAQAQVQAQAHANVQTDTNVQLKTELKQLKTDLEAIYAQLQREPAKDDLIKKLQQKLSDIYKQQIIDKANMDLARLNYVAPTYIAPSTIKLTKTNRDAAKKILDMFGGSGITMKGGTIVHFSYDDDNDSLQQIDINDIQILTNAEITEIEKSIKTLKDKIVALESNNASSDKVKLLIQELLLIKAVHAQNFKALLFEKIANGINKQIITTQSPVIEQLKTANKDLETKHVDLEAANKDLENKYAELEKDLIAAKNASTVSTKSTSAINAAKINLDNRSMYKDKNVIYYKMNDNP